MTTPTKKSEKVNGRIESPKMHDILTCSTPDGRVAVSDKDTTCGNWTKSGEGAAIVGQRDRWGLRAGTDGHGAFIPGGCRSRLL